MPVNTASTTLTGLPYNSSMGIDNIPSLSPQKPSIPSSNTTTVIAAASAIGGIALIACLGAVGFYACRKKRRANKGDGIDKNETGIALGGNTQTTTKQSPSQEYGAFPALGISGASGTVTLGTNRMSEYASFRSPSEVASSGAVSRAQANEYVFYPPDNNNQAAAGEKPYYSSNFPPVPTDPYDGVQFANLGELNREVDERKTKQQALHQTYDDVTVLAPKK